MSISKEELEHKSEYLPCEARDLARELLTLRAEHDKALADNAALREGLQQVKIAVDDSRYIADHQDAVMDIIDGFLSAPNPGAKILAVVKAAERLCDSFEARVSESFGDGDNSKEFFGYYEEDTNLIRDLCRALDERNKPCPPTTAP